MNKLFASFLIAAVSLSAAAAQAMPFGSNQTQDNLIVPIAGGCGVGWHPTGYGCRRNGYYGGPVVVAPPAYYGGPGYYAPVVGPCGGRGAHQVCGPYGNCRMVCNY
jgi:hypothetical protein